nr:hypothetical protein BN993_00685 [Virgibacillus halodenitrificans]
MEAGMSYVTETSMYVYVGILTSMTKCKVW